MKRFNLIIPLIFAGIVSCASGAGREGKIIPLVPEHGKGSTLVPATPSNKEPGLPSIDETGNLPSGIVATWKSSADTYYIRLKENDGIYALGSLKDGSRNEKTMMQGKTAAKVRRFFVLSDAYHVLWTDNTLERVPLASGEAVQRQCIYDALPVHDSVVLIEEEGRDLFCERNGLRIPLSISGKVSITWIADNRVIFISDGSETEVVDALVPRSLYVYPAGGIYASADSGNLRISAIDTVQPGERIDDGRMVFFMVYVDGIESGRTPAGPSSLPLTFMVKVEPDAYHIVRLERWELDRGNQRYVRANNINQPEPVNLLVPLNRVVTVDCRYNGRSYNITTGLLR